MSIAWIGWMLTAYVVGSIPFGVIIGRARGIDIREHGSRNIGATNVLRVLGRRLGIACFLLDVAKGALPVIFAGLHQGTIGRTAVASAGNGAPPLSPGEQLAWIGIALAAVLGHMFSIFLGGRGGKGVATGFGGIAGLWPVMTIPCGVSIAIWIVVLRTTRYVSLASIIAAASLPVSFLITCLIRRADLAEIITGAWPTLLVSSLLAALVLIRHRSNIGRLLRNEEPKTGRRTEG